jgi:hypothetical protein
MAMSLETKNLSTHATYLVIMSSAPLVPQYRVWSARAAWDACTKKRRHYETVSHVYHILTA